MGEPVTVREKPSSNPELVRFEINRSLTGMGHERYASVDDIILDRPVDEIARRLFAAGGVAAVHVNSSVITVNLAGGSRGEGLAEIIGNLFRFYPDSGASQTSAEHTGAEDSGADDVGSGDSDSGDSDTEDNGTGDSGSEDLGAEDAGAEDTSIE